MKLIIAEKPSVAKSIASALGAKSGADGCFQGNGLIVSWCVGHLVSPMDAAGYDERFKKWRYDDLPILPEPFRYVLTPGKEDAFENLRTLMNRPDVDTVVNACDAGREGELIFRLVYEMVGCTKPIERLWISSMEDIAIREGFSDLRPGAEYDSLYQSALCRQKADWLVGINATRLFSVLYHRTLNVGRVQTPTLAMLAERDCKDQWFPEGEIPLCAAEGGRRRGGFGKVHRSGTRQSRYRPLCQNGQTCLYLRHPRAEEGAAPEAL